MQKYILTVGEGKPNIYLYSDETEIYLFTVASLPNNLFIHWVFFFLIADAKPKRLKLGQNYRTNYYVFLTSPFQKDFKLDYLFKVMVM